jgi:hypothetical protein
MANRKRDANGADDADVSRMNLRVVQTGISARGRCAVISTAQQPLRVAQPTKNQSNSTTLQPSYDSYVKYYNFKMII